MVLQAISDSFHCVLHPLPTDSNQLQLGQAESRTPTREVLLAAPLPLCCTEVTFGLQIATWVISAAQVACL